ncbi:MAG: N-acetyl-alpha-D-glucosaminyl L-malate synthase BshA [bacterium]
MTLFPSLCGASGKTLNIGILCYPTVGGSGTVASELARALAMNGNTVHLFSYAQPFRLQRMAREEYPLYLHTVKLPEYPLFHYYPHLDFSLVAQIASAIDEFDLNILHAHYAFPFGLIAYSASQISRKKPPVLTTLHGTDITFLAQQAEYYPVVKFSLQKSTRVSAVSQYLVQRTQRLFPDIPITYIPNFIDPQYFHKTTPNPLMAELKKQGFSILIHISNLRRVKRVPETVEIFAQIHQKIPSYLFILGEGPEEFEVRRKAKELGISEFVRCEGIQNNIPEYLSGSDLMLLLSSDEGFGLVALEAMACGVPVVATNTGGLPELIDSQSGILVDNIHDAVEAVLEILSFPERHRKMSKSARNRATTHFSLSRIFPRYLEWYRMALG